MKKLIFSFLIVSNCWQTLSAQDASHNDSTTNVEYRDAYTDSGDEATVDMEETGEEQQSFQKPVIRVVTADSIKKLVTQDGFGYMRYIDSFYRSDKPIADIQKSEPTLKNSRSIFDIAGIRMLYWALALMAVLFLIYKLLLGNTALFTKNRRIHTPPTEAHDTPITIDHISQMLDKAINEKNYRLAVRLMYLQTISLLGEKHLLHVSPQKTNYQYVQELHGTALQQPFSTLTMQYEYAWFGGFPISNTQFDEIRKGYHHFKSQL